MDKIAAARAELWEAVRFLEKLPPIMKDKTAPVHQHIERALELLVEPDRDKPGESE